jgi:hypothetical protein
VPTVAAERELLAPRDDVWRFVSEPYHLSDWWPGISGVEPDRRGFAEGARWSVQAGSRPGLLRGSAKPGLLLVEAIEPGTRFAFFLTGERVRADLHLRSPALDRTTARLEVDSPWLVGLGRSFPRRALDRLHDLCQTGAA